LTALRNSSAILAVAAFLLQTLNNDLIIAGFQLNRNYIARTLCEQRSVPNNSCHGCCQLRKKLNDEEQKETSRIPGSSREEDELQYVLTSSPQILDPSPAAKRLLHVVEAFAPSRPAAEIFHPPRIG